MWTLWHKGGPRTRPSDVVRGRDAVYPRRMTSTGPRTEPSADPRTGPDTAPSTAESTSAASGAREVKSAARTIELLEHLAARQGALTRLR